MEINQTKKIQVNAKTFKLHIKVCDEFSCQVTDEQCQIIGDYEGYVPSCFPDKHYGDYLILNIDIDTGKITNWITPKPEDIEAMLQGQSHAE